jgi:hypothetical protein
MSFNELISQGIDLIEQAAEADEKKNYSEALTFYQKALGFFVSGYEAMKDPASSSNPASFQAIKASLYEKILQYLERAEELKKLSEETVESNNSDQKQLTQVTEEEKSESRNSMSHKVPPVPISGISSSSSEAVSKSPSAKRFLVPENFVEPDLEELLLDDEDNEMNPTVHNTDVAEAEEEKQTEEHPTSAEEKELEAFLLTLEKLHEQDELEEQEEKESLQNALPEHTLSNENPTSSAVAIENEEMFPSSHGSLVDELKEESSPDIQQLHNDRSVNEIPCDVLQQGREMVPEPTESDDLQPKDDLVFAHDDDEQQQQLNEDNSIPSRHSPPSTATATATATKPEIPDFIMIVHEVDPSYSLLFLSS